MRDCGQKQIHRPELEEMYGFDTKYACTCCDSDVKASNS